MHCLAVDFIFRRPIASDFWSGCIFCWLLKQLFKIIAVLLSPKIWPHSTKSRWEVFSPVANLTPSFKWPWSCQSFTGIEISWQGKCRSLRTNLHPKELQVTQLRSKVVLRQRQWGGKAHLRGSHGVQVLYSCWLTGIEIPLCKNARSWTAGQLSVVWTKGL